MQAFSRWKYTAIFVWLGAWIYRTRFAMLDDALIHLRYAVFLRRLHFITYDGVRHSYGTSSLLYVFLLALLRNVSKSVMLPKATSTVFYLLGIFLLLLFGRQFRRWTTACMLWMTLLFAALSPMAIRWLTDGMETSLALCGVGVLASLVVREGDRKRASAASYIALAAFGAVLVLLRTEIASLLGLSTLALAAARAQGKTGGRERVRLLLHSSALSLGAVLAMMTIRLTEGSFLPDTALAKSSEASFFPLLQVAEVTASALLLGVGTTAVALLSGLLYLRRLRRSHAGSGKLFAWGFANACYPLFLVLACLRGQAIQGVRYVLWTLIFSSIWNLTQLAKQEEAAEQPSLPSLSVYRLLYACALIALCILPMDWHYAWRAMAGRAQTFLAMRDSNLNQYSNAHIVAGDVGFIGYFTGGSICDLNGLVNGLAAAVRKSDERVRDCAREHPEVLFVTAPQADYLSFVLDMTTYTICRDFDFQNVRGRDRHYLMVSKEAHETACPVGSGAGVNAGTRFLQSNFGRYG